MAVFIHVAHGDQGAILRIQRGVGMGQGIHALSVALVGQQLTQFRVAVHFKRHVGDKVRQLVAGVVALEMGAAVDVVAGVDQPVGIKHDDGVDAQLTTAAADFLVAVDGSLTEALLRAIQFRQVHGRNMRDFCS